jgi:ferrous iron transport protein B
VTALLWVLLNIPAVTPPAGMDEAQAASYQMEHSIAGRVGTAIEPVFAPLGFNWQVNVAMIGSLAAREVFVSTLAVTTASESEDALPERLQQLTDADGEPVFSPPTVAAVLIFFVYALQCLSTVVVLRRESNSRKWPALAFASMFAFAYLAAFVAHAVVAAVTA